jgi:hypothetical protein
MTHEQLRELLMCSRDPWYFLTHHVKTIDPQQGVRNYPDYIYLKDLVADAQWHRYLLVPKSRQMMVTWTMVALFLWRAIFKQPGVYMFLSRNERCAEELLDRARFILEHLPAYMRPQLTTNNKSELEFGGLQSRLLSLPATPDGPRMYSPTAVLWDEMAFTPFDSQIWTALKPALSSGGSFVGVSSSGGALNLFAQLVQTPPGSKDSEQTPPNPPAETRGNAEAPPLAPPLKRGGIGSLFHIHKIHYSQHPERDENWKQLESRGLSLNQWNREQEISFEHADDLVYLRVRSRRAHP